MANVASIKLSFWLPIFSILAVVAIWLASIGTNLNQQKSKAILLAEQSVRKDIGLLLRGIEVELSEGKVFEAENRLQALGIDINYVVLVALGKNKEILFSLNKTDRGKIIEHTTAGFDNTQFDKSVRKRRVELIYDAKIQSLTVYTPIQLARKSGEIRRSQVGVIYAEYDLSSDIRQLQRDAIWQSLQTLGFLAIATAILFVFIRRYITHPIQHIIQVARDIGVGREDERTEIVGRGEFAILADSINDMADKMQRRFSDREEALKQVREDQVVMDGIFESIPDLYFLMRADGTITDYRTSSNGDLYRDPNTFLNKKMQEVLPSPVSKLFDEAIASSKLSKHLTSFEYSLVVGGVDQFFEARLKSLENHGKIIAVIRNITDKHEAEEKIVHQAYYDGLTDLPNRYLLLERLNQKLTGFERSDDLVAALFLDLDDFKKINDSLGHDVGDEVLKETANRLRKLVREGDTVARQGGDEFIFILGALSSPEDAGNAAEAILRSFSEPFKIKSRDLLVSSSIGIALSPVDGVESADLLRKADAAMYHAKSQGRNSYAYFAEHMNKGISRRMELEQNLSSALKNNEFEVYFQPKYEMATNTISGAEALLRWKSPYLGMVSPVEFIPLAEQTGHIVAIGDWVMTSCMDWLKNQVDEAGDDFKLAINVSPRQFRELAFVNRIQQLLIEYGQAGDRLVFEVTEGVLLGANAFVEEALTGLSELNISISMDDFGTGYSSMNYLRQYPFDELKIDRSFVNDIESKEKARRLVKATIDMAHGLGLKVVAEGVETEGQSQILKSMGCDIAQGFLFSRPLPAEDFNRLLKA